MSRARQANYLYGVKAMFDDVTKAIEASKAHVAATEQLSELLPGRDEQRADDNNDIVLSDIDLTGIDRTDVKDNDIDEDAKTSATHSEPTERDVEAVKEMLSEIFENKRQDRERKNHRHPGRGRDDHDDLGLGW